MLQTITYENNLPINAELLTISSYPIHMHRDIQILYVLKGEVDLTLAFETYQLKENDLHYIHSEDLHSISSQNKDNLVISLSINTDYIEKIYPNIRTTVFTMTTDKSLLLYYNQQMELKACIFLMLEEILQKGEGYVERIGEITKTLFEALHKDFRGFTVDKTSKAFVHKRLQDIRQTERLCEIISDIYTNYVEPSTLEEIAAKQNLNLYYLSHLFSQTVGINYRDFVNMVRVETSEYDLLASDFSISHIALSSGFSNASYYTKHFLYWYGMTPKEYRLRNLNNIISVKSPDLEIHRLKTYETLIQENLKTLMAACKNFTTTLTNQTITYHKLKFEEGTRVCLNLNCYNPDYLSIDDNYFKEKRILRADFIKKYFHSVKVIIEEPAEPIALQNDFQMYAPMEKTLLELTQKLTCEFNFGRTGTNGSVFTANNMKTPLYYILEFLARGYDGLHVNSNYIILKDLEEYHIMCWNLHLSQPKDITIKGGKTQKKRLAAVSKIQVDNENEENRQSGWEAFSSMSLSKTTTKIIENAFAPEEEVMVFESRQEAVISIQLPSKSICFISIAVL